MAIRMAIRRFGTNARAALGYVLDAKLEGIVTNERIRDNMGKLLEKSKSGMTVVEETHGSRWMLNVKGWGKNEVVYKKEGGFVHVYGERFEGDHNALKDVYYKVPYVNEDSVQIEHKKDVVEVTVKK